MSRLARNLAINDVFLHWNRNRYQTVQLWNLVHLRKLSLSLWSAVFAHFTCSHQVTPQEMQEISNLENDFFSASFLANLTNELALPGIICFFHFWFRFLWEKWFGNHGRRPAQCSADWFQELMWTNSKSLLGSSLNWDFEHWPKKTVKIRNLVAVLLTRVSQVKSCREKKIAPNEMNILPTLEIRCSDGECFSSKSLLSD